MSRYRITLEGPNSESLEIKVPSVTEIIDEVLSKPRLHDWYYQETVRGLWNLHQKYGDTVVGADIKTLHSLLKSEGLSPYAARDSAADEGKKIHKHVEALAKGRRPPAYPTLTEWWKAEGFRAKDILGTESLVYSAKNGYAGTIDLVYTRESTVLADIKTGKLRDSHEIQLEFYRWAWEEMGRESIDTMQLIQVPRDGSEVVTKDVPISEELTLAAAGLLQAYRWRK